jgi:hypothetical protein
MEGMSSSRSRSPTKGSSRSGSAYESSPRGSPSYGSPKGGDYNQEVYIAFPLNFQVDIIEQNISQIKSNIQSIEKLHSRALAAASPSEQKSK